MAIVVYGVDRYSRPVWRSKSLTLKLVSPDSRVWCYADGRITDILVDQSTAHELMGVRSHPCPNEGTFSKAQDKKFYWRGDNRKVMGQMGVSTIKLREETCLLCGYTLTTEGDPNLTASFYPERGGHSGIPHPERVYWTAADSELSIKEATYSVEEETGITPRPNQGTLGVVLSRALISPPHVQYVENFIHREYSNAVVLDIGRNFLIFQDGPTGYE